MEDLSIKNVGDLRYSISVSHRDTAFFVLTPFKMIQRRRSKHSWSSIGSFVGWLWLITINIVSMCPWLGLQKKHQASRGTSQDFRLGSFGAIFLPGFHWILRCSPDTQVATRRVPPQNRGKIKRSLSNIFKEVPEVPKNWCVKLQNCSYANKDIGI